MKGFSLLTEQEAQKFYRSILESYQEDGSLEDKANRLRSIFDFILRSAIDKKYHGNPPNDKTRGFQVMVDDLFYTEDFVAFRNTLHEIRELFNGIQHQYRKGRDIARNHIFFSSHDYRFCLQGITELVQNVSNSSIPPQLIQACKKLSYKKMKYRLEIIILLELFDKLEHAEKGIRLLNNIENMIKEKEEIGLDLLSFHIITYSPTINVISPIEHSSDIKKNEFQSMFVNPVNDGISKGLDIVGRSIDYWMDSAENKTDKPWFIWLCNSLKYDINPTVLNKLQQLIDADVIGFYPIALDSQETLGIFEEILPNCGPKNLDSNLSENFFKSILNTVQRMHTSHILKVKRYEMENSKGNNAGDISSKD